MLRTLRWHPLLVGAGEMLADAARYIAVMAIMMILLGQLVRFLGGGT